MKFGLTVSLGALMLVTLPGLGKLRRFRPYLASTWCWSHISGTSALNKA